MTHPSSLHVRPHSQVVDEGQAFGADCASVSLDDVNSDSAGHLTILFGHE
jgi:hypothetical protein